MFNPHRNPIPVAACLVPVEQENETHLLGIIRNNEPGIGGLALPGGYVDEGESIEQAAARELLEETGLETNPDQWSLCMSRVTPENRVLVFCVLDKTFSQADLQEQLRPNREVQRCELIDATSPVVFASHQDAILHFFVSRVPA